MFKLGLVVINATVYQSVLFICYFIVFVIPQRWIFAIMGFLATVCAFAMRISLSLAITVLVESQPTDPAANQTNTTLKEGVCEALDGLDFTEKKYVNSLWSEAMQGLILGSFYIGYLITHMPAGFLADRYGGKWVLVTGFLITIFCTFITPIAIEQLNATGLIMVRIMMGLGDGVLFPALSALLSAWTPTSERTKIGAFVFSGCLVGIILTNMISGVFLERYHWSLLFYFFATVSTVWLIIFISICYNYPEEHPCIKPKERDYLLQKIGNEQRRIRQHKRRAPWCQIFKNKHVIALIIAQIGHDWAFYCMISTLPKYMSDVMQFSIKANGLYTTLPFLAMFISSIIAGIIADVLIRKEILSITNVRKMMTAIAAFAPGALFVGASYSGCNRIIVVVQFTFCLFMLGTYYAGARLGPLDMSPNYAGILMALSNGLGATTGILAPITTGLLTPDATLTQWRLVFWIASGILVLSAIIYLIWASGEVQPFDELSNDTTEV